MNPPRLFQCKGIHRGFDPTEKNPVPDYNSLCPPSPSVEKEKFQKMFVSGRDSRLFLCLSWLFGKCLVFTLPFSSMNLRSFCIFGVFVCER